MTFPLEGIRVLDLSQAISGPYAGRLLADLGADVVKVEWPRGDITNVFGKKVNGVSGLFAQMNAGKRGLGVDLAVPEGVALVRQLAARADVLIENFRPGVLDRAGLGYEMLRTDNPSIVVLSISGFGRSSAECGRRVYAPVIHAEAGLIHRQAAADGRPPTDVTLALADSVSALHGTIAVLAALALRTRTGSGQHIDLSMLDAMLASDDYSHHAVDGEAIDRIARGMIWDAPGGPILIAADAKTLWARISEQAGLTDQNNHASIAGKAAARTALIATWIRGFENRAQLVAQLVAADLAWGDIRQSDEVLIAPAVTNRDVVAWVDDGAGGSRGIVRSPYRFSDAECDVRGAAPARGRDNDAVLSEWLGLTQEDVDALRGAGALS